MAQMLNAYPLHYKTVFAFSSILYPLFHQSVLRLLYPDWQHFANWENIGLTLFRLFTREG
jgi:hypothetical protein